MTDVVESNESSKKESSSPLRSRMVKLTLSIGLIFLLLMGGWWYWNYQTSGKYFQSTNNAYIASDTVIIAPKISGYVDRVLVQENQGVQEGDVLLELDGRDYRAQEAQVQAQIQASLANAQTVQAQIGEQEAAISQAEAQLAAVRADAALTSDQLQRYEPLAASGAEPRERLDQLRAQASKAEAQLDASQAALLAAKRRVRTLEEQVGLARSQADAGRAQLAGAQLNVESTVLRASSSGRIGDVAVRQGQFVQPGTRLMSIVPVEEIYIKANFKETQLGLMRAGQPVVIEVDALPDLEIDGRVASIAPGTGSEFSILPPENATGNFTKIVQRVPVRIEIMASLEVRRLLVSGMSVVVTVDTRSAKGQLDDLREAVSQN